VCFSALENLEDNEDINRAWDAIRENIKISGKKCIGHCEAKHLKLVDQRKQAKLQWLQDPSVVKEDNLSNVRREASRHFRNKKVEYLKDKINELESNSKNKNIRDPYRGTNKKGYQPRTNLVKDEKGDLVTDPHKIVNMWMNYFCQLLNVQRVGGIRQTEIQTAETFVPEPSISEVEVAIGKLKRYKLPGADSS
jgi:anti-sigma28 factor (negative regulator of flagellin synthesis)